MRSTMAGIPEGREGEFTLIGVASDLLTLRAGRLAINVEKFDLSRWLLKSLLDIPSHVLNGDEGTLVWEDEVKVTTMDVNLDATAEQLGKDFVCWWLLLETCDTLKTLVAPPVLDLWRMDGGLNFRAAEPGNPEIVVVRATLVDLADLVDISIGKASILPHDVVDVVRVLNSACSPAFVTGVKDQKPELVLSYCSRGREFTGYWFIPASWRLVHGKLIVYLALVAKRSYCSAMSKCSYVLHSCFELCSAQSNAVSCRGCLAG